LKDFKDKCQDFLRYIHFIQRRIKDKLKTLQAKVDVVRQYWDQCLFSWLKKASLLGDEGMKKLLNRIMLVKP
jgi:hypothetical protein